METIKGREVTTEFDGKRWQPFRHWLCRNWRTCRHGQPTAWRSGMLDVQPQKAGPLMVPGNVEPVSGTGRTVNRATRVFFGRGSQSRTKPCCDNSHKSVGFIADPG